MKVGLIDVDAKLPNLALMKISCSHKKQGDVVSLASPNWKESIVILRNYGQPVKFEGIDIRILKEEMLFEFYKLKLKGRAHIAWDNPAERVDLIIEEKIPRQKRYKFICYVLIGYDSTHSEDMFRVMRLRNLWVDPFVMPYDRSDSYQSSFARWVNHKAAFMSCTWKNYRYRVGPCD